MPKKPKFKIGEEVLYTRIFYNPIDEQIESRIDNYTVTEIIWDYTVNDWLYKIESRYNCVWLFKESIRRRTKED